MDVWMSAGIGLGVAIGVVIAQARQRKQNATLHPRIEECLRAGSALTLPELAGALGMGGFLARGKVALALNDMVSAKRVQVIAAPEGHTSTPKGELHSIPLIRCAGVINAFW